MFNFLASLYTAETKAEASDAYAPNQVFEPFPGMELLAVAFFLASAFMVWLMLRSGKGYDYNS